MALRAGLPTVRIRPSIWWSISACTASASIAGW
ncbi:Uncharacterised protein [Bordetella pertussis]|nr:Uncharacterised protein [Bordetella pertussis]CFW32997.1 Uncharacterised protein [Bordetella pertussis]